MSQQRGDNRDISPAFIRRDENRSRPFDGLRVHIGPLKRPADFDKLWKDLRDLGAELVRSIRDSRINLVVVDVGGGARASQVLLDEVFDHTSSFTDKTEYILNRFCRLLPGSDPGSASRASGRQIVLDYLWVKACRREWRYLGEGCDYAGMEIKGFLPGPQARWDRAPPHIYRLHRFRPDAGAPAIPTGRPLSAGGEEAEQQVTDAAPALTRRSNFVPSRLRDTEHVRAPAPVSGDTPAAATQTAPRPHGFLHEAQNPSGPPPIAGSSHPEVPLVAPAAGLHSNGILLDCDALPFQSLSTPTNALRLEEGEPREAPGEENAQAHLHLNLAHMTPPETPTEADQSSGMQKRLRSPSFSDSSRSTKRGVQAQTEDRQTGTLFTLLGLPMGFHVIGPRIIIKSLKLLFEKEGGTTATLESATFVILPVEPGEPLQPDQAQVCTMLGRARAAVSYTWIRDCIDQGALLDLAPYRLE